ncbi:LysR family transcriptional regulator [Emcibacter sp.]|uniref:LysR family transcriptional regulator n=1 Tax=Emcibacter sp. TaxID=1979954 RepID=UPI002AA8B343|nr:LysR family transcriptional regulator [Emcibacter sp.]
MDKLSNIRTFAVVGQTGSFAEAARRLNLANSVVSKRVKDLEDHLGTRLLIRTTRHVSLTDAGYQYLEQVQKLLHDLEETEESLRRRTQTPIGNIRVAAPLSFGIKYLGPAMSGYLDKYPQVSLNVSFSNRFVDIAAEGYDLAIRVASTLPDSNLMARQICASRRIACASPGYLARHGIPETPRDLLKHNCLTYDTPVRNKGWPFYHNGRKLHVPVHGNLTSDNGEFLCAAAICGQGIVLMPTFIVGQALSEGDLVPILDDYREPEFYIYVLYPHKKLLSVKVRTLIDFLADYFEDTFA